MINGGASGGGNAGPPTAPQYQLPQQFNDASHQLFQQNAFHAGGMVGPFPDHLTSAAVAAAAAHSSALQQQAARAHSEQRHHASAGVLGPSPHAQLSQLASHPFQNTSDSFAAALFANSSLLSNDLKLAAAAAATAAAAAHSNRNKKPHRVEPVPQSGFKGVSWNSRMKAWLAFYVTENGERKSKTFSTRKLGMEEARLQAITFCKQKQDQRRERKRTRDMHCGVNLQTDDEQNKTNQSGALTRSGSPQASSSQQAMLRCGFPTTPGLGQLCGTRTPPTSSVVGRATHLESPTRGSSPSAAQMLPTPSTASSEISYVPIVAIGKHMIEKSGLLQPLELNHLPPCQHCRKQPYPFLMIVPESPEQPYNGGSIVGVSSQGGSLPAVRRDDAADDRSSSVPSPQPDERGRKSSVPAHPADESSGNKRQEGSVKAEAYGDTLENVESSGCAARTSKDVVSHPTLNLINSGPHGNVRQSLGCSTHDSVEEHNDRRGMHQETHDHHHRIEQQAQQRHPSMLHDASRSVVCHSGFTSLPPLSGDANDIGPSSEHHNMSNNYRDQLGEHQASVLASNASYLVPSVQLAMNLHCNVMNPSNVPNPQQPFMLHHTSPSDLSLLNSVGLYHPTHLQRQLSSGQTTPHNNVDATEG